MYSQPGKKMSRNSSFILDLVHIVIGLAIVVLAVLSFLNPNGIYSVSSDFCAPAAVKLCKWLFPESVRAAEIKKKN